MRLIFSFLLSLYASWTPALAAQAKAPLRLQSLQFKTVAPVKQLFTSDGERVRRSWVMTDSKGLAFHLGPEEKGAPNRVLKVYTGPGYAQGERTQAEINDWGRQEAARMQEWSALGLALPVIETGQTPEGAFFAVFEMPRRTVSGRYLVRKGQLERVRESMEQMAQALAEERVALGTENPTQFVFERGRGRKALITKTYTSDELRLDADTAQLAGRYAQNHAYFQALQGVYKDLENGAPLSALPPRQTTTDRVEIARMVLAALRGQRDLHIVYRNKQGQTRHMEIQPFFSPEGEDSLMKGYALPEDTVMKGYVNAIIGPRSQSAREKTRLLLRLDGILEAEFLPPLGSAQAPAPAPAAAEAALTASPEPVASAMVLAPGSEAPTASKLSDEDVRAVAFKVAAEKGSKRYASARQAGRRYLRANKATEAQFALFTQYLAEAAPNEGLSDAPRPAITNAYVLTQAEKLNSWRKDAVPSDANYREQRYLTALSLVGEGATIHQMALFSRQCPENPGGFSDNAGGT